MVATVEVGHLIKFVRFTTSLIDRQHVGGSYSTVDHQRPVCGCIFLVIACSGNDVAGEVKKATCTVYSSRPPNGYVNTLVTVFN